MLRMSTAEGKISLAEGPYMGALGEWLTTQEAANLAGYHVNYLRRLVRVGEIEARKWGNAWMINRESLLTYLARVQAQGEKRGPKPEKT